MNKLALMVVVLSGLTFADAVAPALSSTLAKDFRSNEVKAEARWLKKEVRLLAVVYRVSRDETGKAIIELSGGEVGETVSFRCPVADAVAAQFDPSQAVIFTGSLEKEPPSKFAFAPAAFRVNGCTLAVAAAEVVVKLCPAPKSNRGLKLIGECPR